MPGLDVTDYLTNSSMMEVDFLPRHLIIVGGSYIGLEFGQMFRRFGSQVTILEKGPRLIGEGGRRRLRRDPRNPEGGGDRCSPECGMPLDEEARGRAAISWPISNARGARIAVGSYVLLAMGRRPNTDDLGLDKAGVQSDDRGYIVVDHELLTSAPGIWALGDCNGKGAFTHTSYNDFEIVAVNILDHDTRRISDRIPADNVYLDPPLGAPSRRAKRRLHEDSLHSRCDVRESAVHRNSARRAHHGAGECSVDQIFRTEELH